MRFFDYIGEARHIRDALVGDDLAGWRARIDEAIAAGSTGTEILMALRWHLLELLEIQAVVRPEVIRRIKDYVLAADKLLT